MTSHYIISKYKNCEAKCVKYVVVELISKHLKLIILLEHPFKKMHAC